MYIVQGKGGEKKEKRKERINGLKYTEFDEARAKIPVAG